MIKVIKDADMQIPIKLWADDIEPGALRQAINLSNLPFAFKHIAIMPDTHQGYGMPIGGVLATNKVIIPNAVGVDIGCGMCAVKTSLKVEQLNKETLKKIEEKIREDIPVGVGKHHKKEQDQNLMPGKLYKLDSNNSTTPICCIEYRSALKQIGTLGAGNHFIEIQKDTENNIWIMVHSGSRNLGYKVAKHYNKTAQELCKKWYSNIPPYKGEDGLAFLPIGTQEANHYMEEMQYCVDFALANRKLMMRRIEDIFEQLLFGVGQTQFDKPIIFEPMINIAHNYARWENHFNENVIVHRKGATSARKGEIGIIPGDQLTKSYIVKGKGNPDSFNSCSHGAGRKMSRTQAKKELNLEEEIKKMDDKGIIHGMRNQKDLDEASGAYKNIDVVMKNQSDLVEILVELTPLAVIKG